MDILLDTHAFLWYFQDSDRISFEVTAILESPVNKLNLSIASLWEISIKMGLGKLNLPVPFYELQSILDQFLIKILPITFTDTEYYQSLPLHHRDPFDRILISQAINHSLVIISADVAFDAYPIQRMWG